ncbi:MAG: N-6 DNA methylase [Patescibacteria group bacterium]
MNKQAQRQLGAFYTPIHTVEYMVGRLTDFDKNSRLLEPSGGDGAFVSVVLRNKLLKSDQITVWDINADVKKGLAGLGIKNIVIKDTLLSTNFTNDSLFGCEQFSHIVGNPPYLNKQSDYIKKNKHKLGDVFKEIGANDTYAMFLYLGCKLLKDNGQLCFIISDTYLTLGIHKKLRKFLLRNYTINEITLCSKRLFKDSGALVNTSIIYLTNKKAADKHVVIFNDCRENNVDDYNGKKYQTIQNNILSYPDCVFDFNGGAKLLGKIDEFKKMVNYLDGGLGMHTTDNHKFLAIADYGGIQYVKNNGIDQKISVKNIDGKRWKFYHKKGGNNKYYLPAEYAIRWDKESVGHYKMPRDLNINEYRRGFIISGICSSLTARLSTVGALWESNKAMCFFPKDPQKHPPEFFVGLLNSGIYNKMVKLLNHTNSIQIRDIKKLPMPDFKDDDIKSIAAISKDIIKSMNKNLEYNFEHEQIHINKIVEKYFN